MRPNRSLLSPSLSWLLPLLVAAVSFGITAWLWAHERQATQRTLKTDFDFSVRQTSSRIEQRIASYEQMLRGVQGLFRASDHVDAARFRAYVDALLQGADFTGIHALAYASFDAPSQPGGREPAAKVAYIVPATNPNLRVLGTDLYADPVRRGAMLLARDSGSLGITPRVLTQSEAELATQDDFLMFLPVYAKGQAIDNVAARRAAIVGWVFAGLRIGDMMSSLYGEGAPGIEVSIHDGVDVSPRTLMFRSGAPHEASRPPRFETQEYIGFAGHTWTLRVTAQPAFEQRYGGDSALIIAIAGIGLGALLALLTRQLLSGRARAHDLAVAMTDELRAGEERYRRIVETADEGIWMTGVDGRTSLVNPKMAQMLDCQAPDMIGQPLLGFAGDAASAQVLQAALSQRPDAAERHELMFRRKAGGPLWVSMVTTPILDASGRAAGTLAMVADITERKRADATRMQLEAQLRESQKMEAIGTLAGGIAHDFNNILAAILGNVALAREQAGVSLAAQANLEQISKAAVRARSLVQQILAFSRRQPLRLVNQPMRPLIEDAARLMRPILPAGVELALALTDAPIHVAADATQMQQVLMNLCTNAWHAHNGQAGRITVGLEALDVAADAAQGLGLLPGRHAHLWVRDTGSGMDEATRARVFEPFFTTKPVGQGTGLGLSVVHGIVAAHRGAIAVSSTRGQGSRFDLYFPQVEPEPAVAALEAVAAEPPRSAGQHVLYVDDDPVMVLMVRGLLRRGGYRVSTFEDSREAMAALRAQPDAFDAVVTDHNMPGLSGLDIARELAHLRPGLPVVISSGYVSEEMLAAASQLGVRSVMQKEYTLEQLADILHRVLSGPAEPGGAGGTTH